jgi:hypothetical protein
MAVAMGDDIFVAGGHEQSMAPGWTKQSRRDGAIFDGKTWHPIPDSPVALDSYAHAAWTGTAVLVVGLDGTIASYTPATNTWAVLGATTAINDRTQTSAVWTGSEFVISGGTPRASKSGVVGSAVPSLGFNPTTGETRTLPAPPGDAELTQYGTWSGTEWLVSTTSTDQAAANPIVAYNPVANLWRTMPLGSGAGGFGPTVLEGSELAAYRGFSRWKLSGDTWAHVSDLEVEAAAEPGGAWFIDGHPVFGDDAGGGAFRLRYQQSSGAWADLGSVLAWAGDAVHVTTASGRFFTFVGVRGVRLRPIVDPTLGVPACSDEALSASLSHDGSSEFIALRNVGPSACTVNGQRPTHVAFRIGSEWIERPPGRIAPFLATGTSFDSGGGGIQPGGYAFIGFSIYTLDPAYRQGCNLYADGQPDGPTVSANAVRFSVTTSAQPNGGVLRTIEGPISQACPDLTVVAG